MDDILYATVTSLLFGLGYAWAAYPHRADGSAKVSAKVMAAVASGAVTATYLQNRPWPTEPNHLAIPWAVVLGAVVTALAWKTLEKLEPDP